MPAWFSRHKERIYTVLIYILVFLFSIHVYSDPDWGWHYKYGEYFLTHGTVLSKDIYTWSMPGYQWYYVTWIFDVTLYFLYNVGSYTALILFQSILTTVSFYLLIANFKLSFWKKALLAFLFIRLSEVASGFGFVDKGISLFFLAVLFWLLLKSQKNNKWLLGIPLLLLVWTNAHGDFLVGIGIAAILLGSTILLDFLKTKTLHAKQILLFSTTLLASVAVTFINPFGYHIYSVVFSHVTNPITKIVYEWAPLNLDCNQCHPHSAVLYSVVLLGLFLYRRKLSDLPYIIFGLLFTYMGFTSVRFLPYLIVATLPFLAIILQDISWDIHKYKTTPYLILIIFCVGVTFNVYNRYTVEHIYTFTEEDYCAGASGCSQKVVSYLLQHPPQGRGFNDYNWGGYLIGKNFPEKIFVDGRMTVWEGAHGYSPMWDWHKMAYLRDYDLFNKYHFMWVLCTDASELGEKLKTKELGNWGLVMSDSGVDYFVRIP